MTVLEHRTDREILSPLERAGEVIIIGFMIALFAFFILHQTTGTGFFTEKFGPLEALCLYVPLLLGLSAPTIRALSGKRQPARPFEAATSLFLSAGSLWLLIAFPFDYSHLADVLPAGIQFILRWVTDDVAGIVLLLQVIIGPISAGLVMMRFLLHRQPNRDASLTRRAL